MPTSICLLKIIARHLYHVYGQCFKKIYIYHHKSNDTLTIYSCVWQRYQCLEKGARHLVHHFAIKQIYICHVMLQMLAIYICGMFIAKARFHLSCVDVEKLYAISTFKMLCHRYIYQRLRDIYIAPSI